VTIDNERPSPTVHWLAVHYGDRLASENHPRRRCPPCGIEYSDCFDVAQYFIPQGPTTPEQRSREAREPGSRGVDERNIFEPVCFVEAGFVMLAVGKGFCQ